jgi:DNA-binding NtrC family response regulator
MKGSVLNTIISNSKHMEDIKKLTTLLKTVNTNIYIYGDNGVGKSHLSKYILPDAIIVYGENSQDVRTALENNDEIIVENIDRLNDIRILNTNTKRIIGISKMLLKSKDIDSIFGTTIHILPLKDRVEDIEPLARHFFEMAKAIFRDKNTIFDDIKYDISTNCHSLKSAVFKSFVLSTISTSDLSEILQNYFIKNVINDDGYREFLKIFDTALITSYQKLFRSQLMMADRLGINRNTLRKKIQELNLKFDDE